MHIKSCIHLYVHSGCGSLWKKQTNAISVVTSWLQTTPRDAAQTKWLSRSWDPQNVMMALPEVEGKRDNCNIYPNSVNGAMVIENHNFYSPWFIFSLFLQQILMHKGQSTMTNPGNSHTSIGGMFNWVRNVAKIRLLSVPHICFSFSFTYRSKAKLRHKPASAEISSISCKCWGLLRKPIIQNFKGNLKHSVNASLQQDFQMRSDGRNLTEFCPARRQQAFAPEVKVTQGLMIQLGSFNTSPA